MVNLVIVGSVALDTVQTPFRIVKNVLGGSAVFSSVAASYFSKPGIVAVVGEDFPQEHVDFLKNRNVNLEGLEAEGKTFRWEGSYEYDMNEAHTKKTELNSFENFNPKLPKSYKKAKYVFLGNINPELQLRVLDQIKDPKLVMLDSMKLWIETKKKELLKVIKKIDVLLLNDGEARMLFDTPNLVKAGSEALKLGLECFIIKKGEHGVLLFSKEGFFAASGYPLENLKDPTGCGDSFAGGLIGYLESTQDISEKNIRKAIIYGSVIASFNAEDYSLNRLKTVALQDIQNRYTEFKKMGEF